MTNASVRDAVYGIGAISNVNTVKNAESTQSKGNDFGKIMNPVKDKAQQTVYQSDYQVTEKKAVPQTKEKYEAKDDFKMKETTKEDVYRKDSVDDTSKGMKEISENEPVDEEVEAAVKDAVKDIMQEVEETLDVSEEELLEAMHLQILLI